ncbi:hypothetical protein [Butyrivibrio sp. WCD3002]|uniref:hypothetical protein n=1 Tax=Butyrivibrio sp. WCD3002 TaxID=1280676 RepID=UPI00041A6103
MQRNRKVGASVVSCRRGGNTADIFHNSIMLRIILSIPKDLKDIPVSYKKQIQESIKRA